MGDILGDIILISCGVLIATIVLCALFDPKNKEEAMGFLLISTACGIVLVAAKILSILIGFVL